MAEKAPSVRLRGVLWKAFLGAWMVLAPSWLLAQTSSVTLSATTVDFGLGLEHPSFSPTKQITLTSSGPDPLLLSSVSIQGIPNEFREGDDCPQNGVLDVGNFCTISLTVFPVDDGPRSATLSIVDSAPDSPQKIALSAIGHPLSVAPSAVSFPVLAVNTSDGGGSVEVVNSGSRPVKVKGAITGDFSYTDGCAPALGDVIPPGGFCFLNVSFTPAAPGSRTGTLTIFGDNVTGPQVIQLNGIGTAAAVSTSPLEYPIQTVGVTSSQVVTLSNVYTKPLAVGGISATGDFSQRNDCDRWLAPNSSCNITVAFSPTDVGPRDGTLVLNDKDPSSPQSVALSGYGVAPMKHIYVHYDYMVMPDQGTACTPRNLFPGDNFSADCAQFQTCIDNVCRGHSHAPDQRAIDTIIEAFRKHGSELHIDPHHTAIPEQSAFIQFGPPLSCPNTINAVNFYDLRNQYFQPSHKFEHYAIFGHTAQDTHNQSDEDCIPVTGASEVPPVSGTGQNFLVAVGYLLDRGLSPDSLVRWEAGTFMHELGHNLGLNHGGGLFDQGELINWKPNYLSVMNYSHQTGIIQADAVGSEQKKSCSRDKDCGPAALCAPAYSNVTCPPTLCAPPDKTKFCTRYDYSDQLLPTGGPTPGVLSENGQLSEPAGLGSGRPDVFRYTDGTCATRYTASDGPVDWDGDGNTTGTGLTVDLIFLWWATVFGGDCPTTNYIPVLGRNDWEDLAALQERPHTGHSWKSNPDPHRGHELTFEEAVAKHILLAPRSVTVLAPSACWSLSPIAGKSSAVTLQLLGADDLDVSQIDIGSLKLHGVAPATVSVVDVNGDGRPDLVLTFPTALMKLHPNAKRMTLTGFLKNSQAFWGHADTGCQ
jgi:hypothetical protein